MNATTQTEPAVQPARRFANFNAAKAAEFRAIADGFDCQAEAAKMCPFSTDRAADVEHAMSLAASYRQLAATHDGWARDAAVEGGAA